jgi:putative SOS response-associated peptidase YedK
MCGRFTLSLDPGEVRAELGVNEVPEEFFRRYNVAPTQPVAVLRDADNRRIEAFKWGLIPSWAKDPEIGSRMINARSETLSEKPSFRSAFARRRCLVLADGFYEWDKISARKGAKTPYHIHLKDRKLMTFAGLWEVWQPKEGEPVYSCTIITCPANELVGKLHDRMPVILSPEDRWAWVGASANAGELQALLAPYPAAEMALTPVSTRVNSPAYDAPDCIAPLVG